MSTGPTEQPFHDSLVVGSALAVYERIETTYARSEAKTGHGRFRDLDEASRYWDGLKLRAT